MTSSDYNLCPYCGTFQRGVATEHPEYYRCHGCNYHIHPDWLVDDPDGFVLNDEECVLCPWCGYPAGLLQKVPEQGEFLCAGCTGTLIGDMLVTQAELDVERKRSMQARHYFLMIAVTLAALAAFVAWVL